MSADQGLHERVASRVRLAFAEFARRRSFEDRNFLRRMRASGRWQLWLSRLFAWLPAGAGRVAGRRYVFFSGRFAQLLSRFEPGEAILVGNHREYTLARRLGLPFRFTAGLLAAASALLFGMRAVPTQRVVADWARFLRRQAKPCYLVVPNDTLPIATLLVQIAAQCDNVVVVCLQHGLFNTGFHPRDIDGGNSDLNLVFCEAQRAEMERRLPGAIAEPMGFPAEFAPLRPAGTPMTAILVGIGTYEQLDTWRLSLGVFARAREVLEAAGFRVQYRPHPSERPFLADVDWPLNLEPTGALLGGERKLFVGFFSTLLFEADAAGHIVVVLNDAQLAGYTLARFGHPLDSSSLDTLPALVAACAAQAPRPAPPELRTRFEQALARAEARWRETGGRGMADGGTEWRIEDEPALLDCMLADAALQPEKYQPGKYWRRQAKSAVREIRRCGLGNFRGRDNGIGLGYTDKQDIDVRHSMNFGARRMLKFALEHLWPMNAVVDGQVRLALRIADEGIREKATVLAASPRVAHLRSRYRIPYSVGGGTVLWSEIDGERIANHYIALLDSIEHMRGAGIGFDRVRSLFEIGGGFGINLHLLLTNFANIRKCVYLDIPPNLYVGTQYLKSHFGGAVKDYRATRGAPPRFADDDSLEILCIAPWQIEQLDERIDLFHNAHSFVEMPEPVVANYAGHVERLLAPDGSVALISYDDFDPATTFHPDRLPSFFRGQFERFEAPMVTSPGAVNFYYLRRGA